MIYKTPVVKTTVYTTFPRWGNNDLYGGVYEPDRVRVI